MKTEKEYNEAEDALRAAGWAYLGAGEWNDPVANVKLLTSTAYEVMVQRTKKKSKNMKLKVCPKCGGKNLGDRWAKGRMMQQYCHGVYDEDTNCGWVGEPRIPEKRRITNKDTLRIDDFHGWHYLIYDKYGHLQTDSATHDTRAEAMEALEEDMTPKEGYVDPAAPLTAVLFFVPANITIKGTMYRYNKGGVNKVCSKMPKAKPTGDDYDGEYY